MRAIPNRGKSSADDRPKPPLAAVLDHYGAKYIHKAGWQKIRCVVHDDSAPSMTINLDSGGFNCHACGAKGGDAIQLVRMKEGCDFATALRLCSEITGDSYESLPSGASGGSRGPSVEYVARGTGIRLNVGGGRVPSRSRRPAL